MSLRADGVTGLGTTGVTERGAGGTEGTGLGTALTTTDPTEGLTTPDAWVDALQTGKINWLTVLANEDRMGSTAFDTVCEGALGRGLLPCGV